MNYKQKYNEALEWMRSLYHGLHGATKEDAEHYFPELKESKDEMIREELIQYLKYCVKTRNLDSKFSEEWIAWIEKQGELNKNATKDRVVKYLSNLISDQALRGVPMLYYEGRIEEEADLIIRVAKNELKNEKHNQSCKSVIWHDITEKPNEDCELLCEWESHDATWHEIVFYHKYTKTFWDGEKHVENVTRWCYVDDLLEKQGEQKPTDKVEPKFKVGDFPELKESEDEKIRKWCISHFKECINVIKNNNEYKEYLSNKVIPWLEKQGDKDKLIKELGKFKKGDWVVDSQGKVSQVKSTFDDGYNTLKEKDEDLKKLNEERKN